jgi:integrase
MPRPSKGPRLALFKAKGRATVWNIRDGQRTLGTGCREGELAEAERKLAAYIVSKHDPRAGSRDPDDVKIADALSVYGTDKVTHSARPKAGIAILLRLNDFFGEWTVGDLTGRLQRHYAAQRGSQSAARRDLETLSAAINHHLRDGGGTQLVFRPTLPPALDPRERWLTREEAARLIRAAWRLRETRDGEETGRLTSRHVARFILVALYTGTRASAVCGAALTPTIGRGYVNLETGQFRRLAYGRQQSTKRQPTVDLPPKLLAHLRRWHRLGISKHSVVEFNGKPVARVSKAWPRVVEAAGLKTDVKEQRVIPHTLRHTAISWYLREGVPIEQVADYCGVSPAVIRRVYRHHIAGNFAPLLAASATFGKNGSSTRNSLQQQRGARP